MAKARLLWLIVPKAKALGYLFCIGYIVLCNVPLQETTL